MERPVIGFVAVCLLGIAVGTAFWEPTSAGTLGMTLRGGLLLGAVWLAFPQLVARPMNWWILAVAGAVIYAFIKLPWALKIGLIAASPLLFVMFWPSVRKVRDRWQARTKV